LLANQQLKLTLQPRRAFTQVSKVLNTTYVTK
jgi:hypothetical protein